MTESGTLSPRMQGRRIVITGAGGISAATAIRVAAQGARVHLISRDPEKARVLAADVPGISWSAADLTSDEETIRAYDEAEAALGGIDGLVAVAGGSARRFGDGPIDQLSAAALHATVDLNLATATNALREFVARWSPTAGQPWASAILIGSALGRFPASPLFVTHGYAATKAAIEGLARSAAAHYLPQRIAINVVAPGLTKTPMAQRAQQDEAVIEYARKRQQLTDDGFLDPDDVGVACEWLLGARTVTGQVIYVDGGWSVYG
jgi:NAD(P)-dependent dehydrogenase (short-subunit alcohol dehydrogenase family)